MRKSKDKKQQQLLHQNEHENMSSKTASGKKAVPMAQRMNIPDAYTSPSHSNSDTMDSHHDIVITPTWADDDVKPRLRDTLCQWRFWSIVIYCFILVFALVFATIPMPIYGAQYFNGDSSSSCDPKANSKYALYSGISNSFGGLFGFFVQGQIGKLTDLHGRKKMMLFSLFVALFSYGGSMTIAAEDLSYYYIVLLVTPFPTCVSGAFGGVPTALQASLADVLPPDHRTVGYGVVFGLAGLAAIFGAIGAGIVESTWGLKYCIYAFDILATFGGLWLMFLVPETLDEDKQIANRQYYRKETTLAREYDKKTHFFGKRKIIFYLKRLGEPFWPLLKMKTEPVLFGIGLIAIFVSLPEAGINDISTSYFYDVLNLCTTEEATRYSTVNAVLSGLTLMVSQMVLLPLMFGPCKLSDLGGFFVGLTMILIMCLIGVIVYFIPQVWVGFLFSLFSSLALLNPPILNGALSRRLDEKEQGIGLGVLHAVKGVTFATAPIAFALLYDNFSDDKYGALKTISFLVGTGFVLCGYPVLFCVLRNALNAYDEQKLAESVKQKFQGESKEDKRYSRLSQMYPDAMLRSELDVEYD